MNKQTYMLVLVVIAIIFVIGVLYFVFVPRSGGGNDLPYQYNAEYTVNGTHILTDGCENADKTKLHLLEESIVAVFDGEFAEASKKITVLNIFTNADCQVKGQKQVMDDIENNHHKSNQSTEETKK